MGKITSMHFTGWKLGLKTGMYYLRTQAAAQPIQFTVDQEQLRVADTNTNTGRDRLGPKKRVPPSGSYVSSPLNVSAPYGNGSSKDASSSDDATADISSTHVVSASGARSAPKATPFKADVEEGESPKTLPTEPTDKPKMEELADPALNAKKGQTEDADEDTQEREHDIYADAVLACSIENPEACVMCSG